MTISLTTYRTIPRTRWRGVVPRRWMELCECGPNGRVRRVIARTPQVVGEDERGNERFQQARREAELMLSGLISQ